MSSYRALFARPKTRALAAACGLGWLSFSSYGLAIVLAVEAATASFGAAGATVAAFTCGSAVLAPLRGRSVDRRGPRALLLFAPLHAIALVVLVIACASWHNRLALIVSGALAGAATPPLIATARAVWARVTGSELAQAGHALNAALGDVAQVVGPALTAIVAAATSPLVALALLIPGAVGGATGTWTTRRRAACSRATCRRATRKRRTRRRATPPRVRRKRASRPLPHTAGTASGAPCGKARGCG
jgi:MFS family permease